MNAGKELFAKVAPRVKIMSGILSGVLELWRKTANKTLLLAGLREHNGRFYAALEEINAFFDAAREGAVKEGGDREEEMRSFIHQVRQPLGILSSGYKTLEKAFEKELDGGRVFIPDDKVEERLLSMRSNCLRIRRQTSEIGYAIRETDAIVFSPEKTNIAQLATDMAMLDALAPDCLVFALPDRTEEPLFVDRGKIVEVAESLVQNAKEALAAQPEMEAKGVITISLLAKEDGLELRVSNNGPSIPLEDRPRIFERNWSTKKASGGNGLGLFIASKIAEGMGGSLGAVYHDGRKSPYENATSFVMEIPARAERSRLCEY